MKLHLLFLCAFISLQAFAGVKSTEQDMRDRQDLLVNILVRVQTEASLNESATKLILSCLEKSNNEQCPLIRSTILQPFQQVVKEARLHLALGYRDSVLPQRITALNSGMWGLGTYKDVWWKSLSTDEEKTAQDMLDRYERSALEKADKKFSVNDPRHERFVFLAVRDARAKHLREYEKLLSQIVILQYIKHERVTVGVMKAALLKMLDRSKKELAMLSQAATAAQRWMKTVRACALEVDQRNTVIGMMMADASNPVPECLKTPSSLLRLLDYQAFVEGFLIENPQYAHIVSELREERKIRSISNLLIFGLPVLAAGIFAPPLLAIPLGGVAGGIGYLMAQNDYNQVRRRELSQVINARGDVDWAALKEARLVKNVSLVMVPFFGAAKPVTQALKLSSPVAKMLTGMARVKSAVVRR